MTMPIERGRSIRNARTFLRSLLDPKKTPKVPRKTRMDAYHCLRHFPGELDMRLASKSSPGIFGEPLPAEKAW